MRIMVDTNVLISALLFPTTNMNKVFEKISQNHTLVICSYVIDEMHDVARRKFPDKMQAVVKMLSKMSYEIVYTPQIIENDLFEIRDIDDYPILYTAIKEGIDIFISGDKDFDDINIEYPQILKPSEFLEGY